MEHYTCAHCQGSLTGRKYVLRQDEPTCIPCYEEKFADKCESCKSAISTDNKDLSYKGKHWHEQCFNCAECNQSLANQQFIGKDENVFCTNCYEQKFADRCSACNKVFRHGMQKFEYSGKKFHHECFICSDCKKPIGANSFVPRGEDTLVCMSCYNDSYADKCAKCKEVLLQGGVTYQEKAYHKECFLCKKCNIELATLKFATKEGEPYCPDCYVKNFSKTCETCQQPIAGLGEPTKYVAFDNRHWHNTCFKCTRCDISLVGQGFLVLDGKVVCSNCGKDSA